MLNFTTFFDFNYLSKGIVLYKSLLKSLKQPFKLYILCLDKDTYNFFIKFKSDFEFIILISLSEIEYNNKDLLTAKKNRSLVEYYFTLSPILPLYILNTYTLDHICSMDADLYFYSSPETIFDNLENYSIIITPHKFTIELKNREKYGLYNVSFQIFKNDEIGRSCLNQWKKDCIEWCKDEFDEENNRFADQKYLDNWNYNFEKYILVLNESNTGLAIWNINNYKLSILNNNFYSDNIQIVFYHFHKFKSLSKNIFLNGFYEYNVKKNKIIDLIYFNYWNSLINEIKKYNLIIDDSIRSKQKKNISHILNECSFYLYYNNKIYSISLKFLPKILRKILIKIYG